MWSENAKDQMQMLDLNEAIDQLVRADSVR